ncbi:MAG: hypothetical protein P8Q37_01585 [Porticoccaceae bacterium]|nr:hypothetical protein [Porticoccaceae bacterium]
MNEGIGLAGAEPPTPPQAAENKSKQSVKQILLFISLLFLAL